MKKYLLISLVLLVLVTTAFAGTPRTYYQKVLTGTGNVLDYVTNTGSTTSANYIVTADIVETQGEVMSTATGTPLASLRLTRLNATTVVTVVQLGTFATQWAAGNTLHMTVQYIPTGVTSAWDLVIPTGTTGITVTGAGLEQIIPPLAPAGFTLQVNSNHPGAAIWKNGVDTGFTTPHLFPLAADNDGTYAVVLPMVTWSNSPLVVPALTENTTITFTGVYTPDPATAVYPLDGAEIHIAWNAPDATYNLEWAAPQQGTVSYYNLNWNGTDIGNIGNVLTWTTPALAPGAYVWTITPVVIDPAKGTLRNDAAVKGVLRANNASKGASTTAVAWDFTIVRDAQPTYPFMVTSAPAGASILIDGVASGQTTPWAFNFAEGFDGIIRVELPDYEWAPIDYVITDLDEAGSVNFVGTYVTTGGEIEVPYVAGLTFVVPPVPPVIPLYVIDPGATTFFFVGTGSDAKAMFPFTVAGPGTWYVYSFYSAVMHPFAGNPIVGPYPFSSTIYVPAMPPTPWTVIMTTSPIVETLPVELSSFTAVLTAEYFVNLTWVTESETEVSGFNVYRSESDNFANAIRINANLIPATNTSEQHTYTMEDHEVVNATYYYWLENVDMGGGQTQHGPQIVTVTGDPTPVLPEISMLNSAYPNPFRTGANTNINVSIKAGETGTVTVYNILGQSVKSFKVNEGVHTLKWDGKGCGSGIYFYKLTTPTTNATKKLVIVK